MPRETARLIQLTERVEIIRDAVERDFWSDDGRICEREQPILDELDSVLLELQEANVARLAIQEIENNWLRADPALITVVQGQAGRRIREFRRDTGDDRDPLQAA